MVSVQCKKHMLLSSVLSSPRNFYLEVRGSYSSSAEVFPSKLLGRGGKEKGRAGLCSRAQPRKLYTTISFISVWPGLGDMSSHTYNEVEKYSL